MKKALLSIFVIIGCVTNAQELPTDPANGYAFPLGSKFTIKLHALDTSHYNYSIISYEQFTETIDTWEHDNLFEPSGQDSTITFYFCLGTHGETEEEKDQNMKVVLLMKNYSKIMLQYTSDIQIEEDGEFQATSNVGTFAGAIGQEIWPYMIYMIGLKDFRNYEDSNYTEIEQE